MRKVFFGAVALAIGLIVSGSAFGDERDHRSDDKKADSQFKHLNLKDLLKTKKLKEGLNVVRHVKGHYKVLAKMENGKIVGVSIMDAKGKKVRTLNMKKLDLSIQVCFKIPFLGKRCYKLSW